MTRRARTIVAVSALALAVTTVPGVPAGAAGHVGTGAAACAPGSDVYKVSGGKKSRQVTHVRKVQVPAKSTRTFTDPAPAVRTITAAVTGAGEYDAAAVLRRAHRTYLSNEDAVRVPGDRTSSEPADLGETTISNPSNHVRTFAGYQAAIVRRGKWTLQVCGDPTIQARGNWRTFSVIDLSGYALCPAPRYAGKSPGTQACRLI